MIVHLNFPSFKEYISRSILCYLHIKEVYLKLLGVPPTEKKVKQFRYRPGAAQRVPGN
jgi:hypothetical protein